MTPFFLKAPLTTPVLLTGGYMTLDGILAVAYEAQNRKVATTDVIPLAQKNGIYRASACFFPMTEIKFGGEVMYARLNHDEMRCVPQAVNLKDGRKCIYNTESGNFRSPVTRFQSVETPYAFWFGVGDIDGVKDLFSNVPGIGRKASLGWGAIAHCDVEIIPLENDFSFEFCGQPARPLPVEMWSGSAASRRFCATQHPFWSSHRVECVVPPTNVVKSNEINKAFIQESSFTL